MADLIQHPAVQALAWALLHFLWQGALIALVAFVVLRAVRSSSARYIIGVTALAAMMAVPVATFLTISLAQPATVVRVGEEANQIQTASDGLALAVSTQPGAELSVAGTNASLMLAAAVAVWIVGVVCFSIRLFGGWVVARRMTRRAVEPASAHIQDLARGLAARLRVNRVVSVMQSGAVAVPVMVGWLKPTVILPVAALAGLSPTQLEALLAHELAHVRRHDYLVNLLQSVAEALLFYHPAVWWLSSRVRAERELCCDDLAVGVCDRLAYATALSELAAMASPRVALAATDGDLLHRVKRILEQGGDMSIRRVSGIPLLILVLAAGIAAPAAIAATQARPPHVADVTPIDFVPAPSVLLDGQARVSAERAKIAVPFEVSPEQSQAQQQVDEKRLQEIRRALEELQKAVAQLEMQRGELANRAEEMRARTTSRSEMAAQLDALARETESRASQRRVEEMKNLFEKGLATEQQVRDAQNTLARTQARGNADELLKLDAQKLMEQLARSRTLFEKGLMSERQVQEQEAALQTLMKSLQERRQEVAPESQLKELADRQKLAEKERAELAEKIKDVQAKSSEAARRLLDERNSADARRVQELQRQELQRMIEPRMERERLASAETANQNEAVRAGDVLRITISGEPDLPSSYQVREDGTIRMPFIGSIKVTGMTAANVRAAVGKQLSDRKLGSANQVNVTLLRGRAR